MCSKYLRSEYNLAKLRLVLGLGLDLRLGLAPEIWTAEIEIKHQLYVLREDWAIDVF